MSAPLDRSDIFPEPELPECAALVAEGRRLATSITVGACAFLEHHRVASEAEYKRRCVRDARLMRHAQIGFRDGEKTKRAAAEIFDHLDARGCPPDRYGICLDWSMGYPRDSREGMPRGTGLILDSPEAFVELTASAPVAPHFGDFVIGTPAAVENTAAALAAGATVIGNLGQYFTFRQPRHSDDVATTAETVKAMALIAAQPTEVLVHSNLDDGYAAIFSDLASVTGMVMVEKYVVEKLLGARLAHCYGHTFSDPLSRLAFQRVLAGVSGAPGSMVYGNTTSFGTGRIENYAALASYLLVDAAAQLSRPTGHALNPVPVSEAERIPEADEIVDAHLFADRLIQSAERGLGELVDTDAADALASRLIAAGEKFSQRVLAGLSTAGVDLDNAFEMLLALRRLGPSRLESLFAADSALDAVAPSPYVATLESMARRCFAELDDGLVETLGRSGLTGCVASGDVHEYGKRLVIALLEKLEVGVTDAGASVDPDVLASKAADAGADFVAISTYNGVALDYVRALISALNERGLSLPVFIGGKLNQIPASSNTALPVDVSAEIAASGAYPCRTPAEMLRRLTQLKAKNVRR